jgi:hypothetical protein
MTDGEQVLQAGFLAVLHQLRGDLPPQYQAAIWYRFWEERGAALREASPGRIDAEKLRSWHQVVWEWIVQELADNVLDSPDSGLVRFYLPGPGGKLQTWYATKKRRPILPAGRPGEN